MILSITKRDCKLGPSINCRTEKNGDDDVPAADFALDGIMLEQNELGQLLGEQYAHRALFNQRGKVFEPLFPRMRYMLTGKYEKSAVTLYLGLDGDANKVTLTGVRLARMELEPCTGGMVSLSLQVQCNPDAEQIGLLHVHKNEHGSVSVRIGRLEEKTKAQPQLPLGDEPPGEDIGEEARAH